MKRHLLAAILALGVWPAQAAQVLVAVAANFSAPMQMIASAFEKDTGHEAVLAFGSTGKLYAQIVNGAPFDMLVAADVATPVRLASEGRALPATQFTYARGALVLWSAQSGLVDARGQVLVNGRFERLALADPKVAPYGQAAIETLTHLGLLAKLAPKLVQGDSVASAHQFVASGNAPLGFVALSQVMRDGRATGGSSWVVPEQWHTPLRQDAIVLLKGRDNPAATALVHYLRSDTARQVMRAFGYRF